MKYAYIPLLISLSLHANETVKLGPGGFYEGIPRFPAGYKGEKTSEEEMQRKVQAIFKRLNTQEQLSKQKKNASLWGTLKRTLSITSS